jgi:O-antigen ligase
LGIGGTLRRSVYSLLLLAICPIPFVFLRSTLDPSLIPQFLAVSVVISAAFALVAYRFVVGGEMAVTDVLRNGLLLSMVAYFLVSVLSLIAAIELGEGVFEVLKIALAIVAYMLFALTLAEHPDRIEFLSMVMTLTGFGLSLIAAIQYFDAGFGWIPGNVIPSATMANKNLLSSILMSALPFSVYLIFTGRGHIRSAASVSATLTSYVLVISQTRSVWLAIGLSGIVTVLTAVFYLRLSKRLYGIEAAFRRRALLALAVLLTGTMAGGVTLAARSSSKASLTGVPFINTSSASMNERLILWDHSLRVYLDNPYIGCGIGNWKINIPLYGAEGLPSETGTVFFQRPHNDFLWVLAETGAAGLLCYLLIFVLAARYCLKAMDRAETDSDFLAAVAILFGVLAYAVDASFSFPKERIVHQVFLMAYLATATVLHARSGAAHLRLSPTGSSLKETGPSPGQTDSVAAAKHSSLNVLPHTHNKMTYAAAMVIIAIVLAACDVIGFIRLKSEIHMSRAFAAVAVSDRERVISEIRLAETPLSALDPTSTPLAWYSGVAHFELNHVDSAMVEFERALKHNPRHVHVLNNLGTCYEVKGAHDTATDYYNRAIEILPSFDEAIINLAAVYYNQGEFEQAYSVIRRIEGPSTDSRYEPFLSKISAHIKEAEQD